MKEVEILPEQNMDGVEHLPVTDDASIQDNLETQNITALVHDVNIVGIAHIEGGNSNE